MAPGSLSDLPEEVLEIILRQPTDIVNLYHYRHVCHSWRSIVDKLLTSSPPHILLYERRLEDGTIDCIRLFNIFTGDSSMFKIPEFKTRNGQPLFPKKVYSWHGWLVVDCFTACMINSFSFNEAHHTFVYKPFSRSARIPIPTCPVDRSLAAGLKLVFGSQPTNPNSIHALAIRWGHTYQNLMFWKQGDEEWTPITPEKETFWVVDVVSYKGGFYAVDAKGNLIQIDLSHVPPAAKFIRTGSNLSSFYSASNYLVKSLCGDLLLVELNLFECDLNVYKLDWAKMEWDEITSLGDDEAIFVASNESVCMRAGDSTVYKRNCIYFIDDFFKRSKPKDKVGVFDMGSKTVHWFPHSFPRHNGPRYGWCTTHT